MNRDKAYEDFMRGEKEGFRICGGAIEVLELWNNILIAICVTQAIIIVLLVNR